MSSREEERQVLLEHTKGNHDEVLESERCGCLGCCDIFPSGDIAEWVNEIDRDHPTRVDRSAICPHCGETLVIGDKGGYEITPLFLEAMRVR